MRRRMFLLKKVIQIREKSHPDHEKPFLEHLEDLRVMAFRVVITLLIAILACFGLQKPLMEILRRPVEEVWRASQERKLPAESLEGVQAIDVDTWERAKQLERAANALPETQRAVFLAQLSPKLAFHVHAVTWLRAVHVLSESERERFLAQVELPRGMRQQVEALLRSGASTEPDQRGNLRMMSALKPTESFMLSMKLALYAGVIVSFPLLLFFVLQFVLPGLHAHEKRVLWPALAIGFGLFLSGVLFAYFQVLPRALAFFQAWGDDLGVSNDWRIGDYISFATQFTLLFGLSFELPVVVMVLVKLGLLSYELMSRTRSHAVVAIFIAAAIITPTPDIPTMLLMAGPMILLYEVCIWLAWLHERRQSKLEEEEIREAEARRIAAMPLADKAVDEAEFVPDEDLSYGPPAPSIRPAAQVSFREPDEEVNPPPNPMDPYLNDPDVVDDFRDAETASGDDGFDPDTTEIDLPEQPEDLPPQSDRPSSQPHSQHPAKPPQP